MQQLDSSMFPGFAGYEDETPSRSSIRSKGGSDYSDWPGFEGESEDLQKLLVKIERRLNLGMEIDARDMDKLIDAGLLELPREYVREGNVYRLSELPEFRSKAAQEGLGYQLSMTPGGGMAYGSGMGGALTGEDTRRILSQQPTGPTPEQISFVEGARGRIASRRAEDTYITSGRPISSINQELERMRQLGTRERAKKGETKAERNYRKWAEANPAQAIELELRQAQEKRRAQELQMTMDKEEMKRELRKRLNEAIKSGNYAPEVIGKLNELKSRSFDQYADVEAIFAEAEGLIAVGNKETTDRLAIKAREIELAGIEWDRRRSVLSNERKDAEDRKSKRDATNIANKNQYALQKDIDEVGDDIAGVEARLSALQDLAKKLGDAPENAERLIEVQEATQSNQVFLEQLQAEQQSKQSRLSQMSGFGGTQAAAPTGLSAEEQAAYDWAMANPNDPRSAQILQALGF